MKPDELDALGLRQWDIVSVLFADHAEDTDEPIRCQVFGRIRAINEDHYIPHLLIDSWIDVAGDVDSENVKRWVILLTAIEQIDILTVRKPQ